MGRPSKEKLKEYKKLETKDTKICSICGELKPLFSFGVQTSGRKLSRPYCLDCQREKQYKQHYDMTIRDYEKLLKQQNGKCPICSTTKPGDKTKIHFCVDHDHKTGKVRGLLCHSCNTGLGRFKDNTESLIAAAVYILKHKGKK